MYFMRNPRVSLQTGNFALGIVVKSPHPPVGGVDLKRKARPAGQRPRIEINEALRQAKCDNKLC